MTLSKTQVFICYVKASYELILMIPSSSYVLLWICLKKSCSMSCKLCNVNLRGSPHTLLPFILFGAPNHSNTAFFPHSPGETSQSKHLAWVPPGSDCRVGIQARQISSQLSFCTTLPPFLEFCPLSTFGIQTFQDCSITYEYSYDI